MYRKSKLFLTAVLLISAIMIFLVSCATSSASGNHIVTPAAVINSSNGEMVSDVVAEPTSVVTELLPPTVTPTETGNATALPSDTPETPLPTDTQTPPLTRQEVYAFKQFRPVTKKIAFTFDDGPYIYTDVILEKIKGTGSKVTFFVVAERLTWEYGKYTEKAIEMGCEIGFHSYDHKDNYTDLTDAELAQQIADTNKLLLNMGGSPVTLLRPVGGIMDRSKDYGYPCILWMADNKDWQVNSNYNRGNLTKDEAIDQLTDTIVSQAANGNIVLMHDLYEISAQAFCNAYDILTAQGYEFVTVSELLGITGKNCDGYIFNSTYCAFLNNVRCSN